MKKMILKLIKKIKEHKLFRKFSCLTVACLLLFYMSSVSVFAAEGDEAAAQPQETESITDVWTAVMDGIMDLINAAQGVFFSSGFDEFVISLETFTLSNGVSLFYLPDLPSLSIGSSGFLTNGDETAPFAVVDSDGVPMISIDLGAVTFDFLSYRLWDSDLGYVWASTAPSVLELNGFSLLVPSDSFSLSFLGTLAVLGLAIAVILLLVYVVVSFIRLRG